MEACLWLTPLVLMVVSGFGSMLMIERSFSAGRTPDTSALAGMACSGSFLIIGSFVVVIFFRQRVVGFVLAMLVPAVRCSNCQEAIPVVDRWKCQCGYLSPRMKNAFLHRCQRCGSGTSELECPRCHNPVLL